MKVARATVALVFAVVLLALPSLASAQGTAAISGTITYNTRDALPANAVVTVQVADIASNRGGSVIAEQRFTTNGAQVPFRYTILYDPTRVNASLGYTIQANISVNGQVRYSTSQLYRVITGGAPVRDVNLVLVGSGRLPNTSGGNNLPLLFAGLALAALATVQLVRARA